MRFACCSLRRFLLRLGVLLAALSLAIPLSAAPSPDTERLVDDLVTVVFGSEFRDQESDRVRKWTGPLRVAVYGPEAGRYESAVRAHLAKLARLTRLDIRLVGSDDPARNAHVLFVSPARFRAYVAKHLPPAKLRSLPRTLACLGLFAPNAHNEIQSFLALIPTGLSPREANACIIEEITQALGLPNDGPDIAPSIFNDDGKHLDLTWRDELFLRVLYDPRVRAGMARAEFSPLAARIIEEQSADGALAQRP